MPAPLTREAMLRHMLAADAAYDGQFITGVVSTGIYCLPSCRARKPLPENVVFYDTPGAARVGGLRACLRCKPDEFYAGEQSQTQTVLAALGRLPLPDVPNVAVLGQHLGLSHSRLHQLFREQLHAAPAEWLSRARVQLAQHRLLHSPDTAAQVAFSVGFESLSAFGQQFRRWSFLTPQAFRRLANSTSFTLSLPHDYPVRAMRLDLGRDGQEGTARVTGNVYQTILRLPAGPCPLQLTFDGQKVHADLHAPLTAADALELHRQLLRLLALHTEPKRFERLVQEQPELAPLLSAVRGLRVPLYASAFDALVWAVLGQQISFRATCTLRRRLLERLGVPVCWGLYAPPEAPAMAALSVDTLRQLGLTRARAELLRYVATEVSAGRLNLESLRQGSAPEASRTLRAIPGIGDWTAQYVLLRGLGFQDALPAADSALQTEVGRFFGLPQRPTAQQTERLMAPFAPYRSLATFYFWRRFASHTPRKP